MKRPLSSSGFFYGGWLSVIALLIKDVFGLSFVSQPRTKYALVGETVDFTCALANRSTHDRVEWWYLNENLQLSANLALLTDDWSHFSLFSSRTTSGDVESLLRISDVRMLDGGYYKCQAVSGSSVLQQINNLIVSDSREVTTDTTTPTNGRHANFTSCCVEEGVGPPCLPICAPASFELSLAALLNCTPYLLGLLKCGSGQRNHIPCCVRRRVPDVCLDICQDHVPLTLNSQLTMCAAYVQSLLDCFQEGYYLLPTPPSSVTAEAVSATSVLISWQPPRQSGDDELSFRIFYQQTSASFYRSTLLTKNFSKIIENLQPNTRYRFYVITLNGQGSSQPSYFIEMTTHQETESVTLSPNDTSLLTCCVEQRVAPLCRTFLCLGEMTSVDPSVDLLPCYSDMDKVFQCISGMRNNTDCCIRYGLSPKCYPLCSGQLSLLTFEQLDCFQEMGIISNCFQEGHENIPGHPAHVVLDSVTSSSAVVRWSLPVVGADRVKYFMVRYREYGDSLYTQVSVYGLNYTLNGLLPSTLYDVAIATVGELGTSLPSPAIVFLTYWVPGFEPTSSTFLPLTRTTLSPPESLAKCCLEQGINRTCLQFCSYSLSPLNGSDGSSLLLCLPYINQFLHCVTDGMNHTECCQRRGVKPSCLGYCSSDVITEQYDVNCLADVPSMLNCFSQDSLVLPSMPMELLVLNKTAHTIILRWQPPSKNSQLVKSYVVSYRQSSIATPWISVNTLGSLFILQNLQPDTTYSVRVVAESEQGTSLPTPEIRSRTLPVNVKKKVNITRDLSECCLSMNVSDSCLPVCAGSEEIGLNECGQDLGKIIKCAADDQDRSACCSRMNIPNHCLDFCRGTPKVDGFPSLICVSFIEQIFTCFHEDSEGLPSPPYQFSYTEIGPTYVILTWREPPQSSANVIYHLYYTSHASNVTLLIKGVRSPYHLKDLQPLTQFDIYLVAVNTFGASTPTVTLTVFTASDNSNVLRVQQDPDGYIGVGSKVTLRCFGSEGASLSWLHRNNQTNGSIFEIDAATEYDGGRYTCVVRGGNVDSADIILRIQYAPDVEPRFQHVQAEVGKDQVAHLECSFLGFPDVVEWQQINGRLIWPSHGNGSRYTTATYVLEDEGLVVAQLSINQVTEDDYDWYACRGSNDFASVTGYVLLAAPGVTTAPSQPPSFLPRVENVLDCCVQKNVSLDCLSACVFDVDLSAIQTKRFQCVPDLPKMVECSADGRNHSKCCANRMLPTRCLSLCSGIVLPPVDVTCLAHTVEIIDCMEMGHGNLPSRPLNVTVSVGEVVSVHWLPPAVNSHLVQYYVVSYSVLGPQNLTFSQVTATSDVELRSLMPFTRYRVSVTAENHHGNSIPSDAVYFFTQEPVPSSPTNVTTSVIDSTTIEVTWSHPLVNWLSVALYYVYFQEEDVESNWLKAVVGQSVFQSTLKDLKSQTTYSIYVTAVSPHFESNPSRVVTVRTSEFVVESQAKSQVGLGVGLFFLFFVSLVVITAIVCWLIRFLRRRHHRQFKESVSFENPSYTSLGDGQIHLPIIQERNGIHSNDYKAGSGSDSSGDTIYVDSITLKEANGLRSIGYASLPNCDSHLKSTGQSGITGNGADLGSC